MVSVRFASLGDQHHIPPRTFATSRVRLNVTHPSEHMHSSSLFALESSRDSVWEDTTSARSTTLWYVPGSPERLSICIASHHAATRFCRKASRPLQPSLAPCSATSHRRLQRPTTCRTYERKCTSISDTFAAQLESNTDRLVMAAAKNVT